MEKWEVNVRGKVYIVSAYSNQEARWKGAQAYYYDYHPNTTISILYQEASCYKVGGRKEIPW